MGDTYPSLPQYDEESTEAILAGRRPSLGENLTANVQEGFWGSGFGQLGAVGREVQGERANPTPMTREEWEASGYARLLGPAWDERMTRGRAAAQAATYDENQTRRTIMQQRDGGVGESVLGFGAQMLGSALSPESFLPIAGPATAALRAARLGRAAEALAAPTILGGVGRGVTEGVLGNALIAPAVYAGQERYGEEITWGRVVGDLAAGAVIGGAFGGIGGALSRYADRQASAELLDAAAADVASGRRVDLPPRALAATVEDAAVRSAPGGAERFIDFDAPAGTRLQDLPTRADGAPLTRGEFGATLEEGAARPALRTGADRYIDVGGKEYVSLEGGHPDIARVRGDVASAAGMPDGPIRLEKGYQNPNNDGGTGEAHIEHRHGEQIRKLGYPDVATFVQDVALRANEVRGDANGGFFLVLRDPSITARGGKQSALIIGLVPDGDAYTVRTAGPMTNRYIEAREKLWPRERTPDDPNGPDRSLDSPSMQRPDATGTSSAAGGQSIAEVVRPGRDVNETYSWYRDALDAQRRIQRMAEAPPERLPEPKEPGAEPIQDPAVAHIETMRTEGRLTAADEAILRAGDEQAAELQGVAKGLTEAGECLLRNLA